MTPHTAQALCQVGILLFSLLVALCTYGSFHFGRIADKNPVRHISRDPNTQRTPIYARTKALVDGRTEYLIGDKIDPWLMMPSGNMRPVTLHDGRTCRYTGVEYEGSPALVFWEALIEPFVKDEVRNVLDTVGKECVANNVDPALPLEEAKMLLGGMVHRVYGRMAYVDQRLRSKPYQEEKAPRRDVKEEIERMLNYVDEHAAAAKALYSKSSH
jgi:hypothetical protein